MSNSLPYLLLLLLKHIVIVVALWTAPEPPGLTPISGGGGHCHIGWLGGGEWRTADHSAHRRGKHVSTARRSHAGTQSAALFKYILGTHGFLAGE
jgi:hypothetical protein